MSTTSPAGQPLPSHASTTPFVGREAERRALQVGWEHMLAGRSQVVLLIGEPGIGKTRTTEEFITTSMADHARVVWGRCYEWDGAPAYWPWVQIIRGYLQDTDAGRLRTALGAGAADIAQLVPEIHTRLPDLDALPPAEPEQARFRLFESIAAFVSGASQTQPLVLVLDDLHWADTPSLLLLHFLAHEVRDARLLIIGTCRNVELERRQPLAHTLAELTRAQGSQRVTLQGLSKDDVARFITLVAGQVPPDGVVEAIYRETDGNPFFLTEVVRLLASEGRLAHADAWQPRVPESVREVISRRLEQLSDSCHRLLGTAAVVGRAFAIPLLEHVSELPVDDLLDRLEEGVRARVIEDAEVLGQYRFTHALIQETLYDALPTTRRLRLHRRIGDELERVSAADPAPSYAELAHHFVQAALGGSAEKAVMYARRAGDRAMTQVAWEAAIGHYQRALQALDLLDGPDPIERCELLLALGEAQTTAQPGSNSPEGRATFRRAADIARQIGAPEQLARAALGFTGVNLNRVFGGAEQVRLLEEALAALDPADSPLRARVLARLATDVYWTHPDEADRTRTLAEDALAMARRIDDPGALAFALPACYLPLCDPDNLEQRLAGADETVRLAERIGDLQLLGWGHIYRFITRCEAGDLRTASAALEACTRIAEQLRKPFWQYAAALLRAELALLTGRFAAAEADLTHERQLWETNTDHYAVQAGLLRYEQARLGELSELIQARADGTTPLAMTGRGAAIFNQLQIALLCLETGHVDAARAMFEMLAGADFSDVPRDWVWLGSIALLSDLCVALNDTSRAALLYDLLHPYSARNLSGGVFCTCYGPGAYYLALLATLLGRWDAAARHCEDALAISMRMGARPWLAHAQFAYAALLVRRAGAGDRERARELLEQSVVLATGIGMPRLLAQASAVRAALVPEAPATAPYGLTAREIEVLRLLVDGRSDREIADALFISPRTAQTHVTNILNKLGVSSRTAAATVAVRHGFG
jgi:DNA-binding CsgD family transcriptional regulator